MIRVAVSGAGGKLAGAIVDAISKTEDLQLSALYNPNRAGEPMAGLAITGDQDGVRADVIVETVRPDVVFDNLDAWRRLDLTPVVGTSGFTQDRLDRLRDLWGTDRPCLVVPNFSIGAVLMMRFAADAATHFEAVEVVERHHATKPDAPSGTALASAMGIAARGGTSFEGSEELVEGALGASVEGVRVHSLRLPGVIAQQEVVFSNSGEVLSIEHLSTSYDSFAAGALLAVRRVQSLSGGVHVGLDQVLEVGEV